ncbi:conserved hypothetical protein [Talaromyces stipitatus ATCC 10500]|uniref:DUF7719 domain-containing protein n=1 Tax=Talaromyces stipitatus (strain ATCC 10500 / CBS 375.48 / QM 6759 / NRRL 1006) TaxID=441959 RepID=B8M329_TALSN|nr:uncharacterized protein TSTA_092480 [Talaromyces stipitatus ATCC 10500]EED22005.1 conserved hypothetical protein [Talaromyces stipitatus ATCC 10500]
MPQNRKQRRAAAAAAAAAADDNNFDSSSIPLSRPPEFSDSNTKSTRQAKTLLEIAAERQQELKQRLGNNNKGKNSRNTAKINGQFIDLDATETQFLEISSSGQISNLNPDELQTKPSQLNKQIREEEEEEEEEGIPPLMNTLLTSIPLTAVHFTLAFLAAHQYIQEIIWKDIIQESIFIAFPVLTFCIHLAHGHIISFSSPKRKPKPKKPKIPSPSDALIGDFFTPRTLFFFLPLAVVLGGYLIHTTNQSGYYAVMKRAPSIGTMWVWCVLEISSPLAALVALLVPLAWGTGVMGFSSSEE